MPQVTYYKPRGIPLTMLECVELTVDELEAIRLAGFEHLFRAFPVFLRESFGQADQQVAAETR